MPVDVDLRIMLTFLELYQTLLGFVMFRLYRDISLVYPPPLDDKRDEGAGGLGAFSLKVASDQASELNQSQAASGAPVKQVSSKAVKEAIKSITATAPPAEGDAMQVSTEPQQEATVSDDFVAQKSLVDGSSTELATLRVIQTQADTHGPNTGLFAPFTFFVSRETPRQLFEFVVRCFGGRIGWHPTQGVGSPISEDDESITHVIIDRPVVTTENETEERRLLRLRRKYVQPQWIMDSINAGKVLLEDDYLQGKTLPPHLSPFGEQEGAYQPMEARAEVEDEEIEGMSAEEDEDEVDEDDAMDDEDDLAEAVEDPSLLRAAELRAEAAGMDAGSFDKAVKQAKKKAAKGQTEKRTSDVALSRDEGQMNKMMMSNKQRKLYTKLKYTETKREAEVSCRLMSILGVCLMGSTARRVGEEETNDREAEKATERCCKLRGVYLLTRCSVMNIYFAYQQLL
jgi:pescadillo protein